jgi:hypothetical protein
MTEKKSNSSENKEFVEKRKLTVEAMLEGTEAGAIWKEIKDKTIEIFALPDQKISQYATPSPVEPSKLYLLTRASSALPAIETAVGKNYLVELADKYVVVSRVVVPLTKR